MTDLSLLDMCRVLELIRPGAGRIVKLREGATTCNVGDVSWTDTVQTLPTDAEIAAGFVQLNDPTIVTTKQRTDAITQLNSDPSGNSKFIRSVLLVILDEVNVIRTALSLPTRTVNQMKTAIQAKLNSGAAD